MSSITRFGILSLAAAGVILMGSGPAMAAPVSIANSGFDMYVAGTTTVVSTPGTYVFGTGYGLPLVGGSGNADFPGWQKASGWNGAEYLNNSYNVQPDGTTGWVSSEPGSGSSLYQDLGIAFAPNSTYTLTVKVYDRFETTMPTTVIARVDADATQVTGATVSFVAPGNGDMAVYTWTYTTGATVPTDNMVIRLGAFNDPGVPNGQANFDDVSLTVVPEPISAALLCVGLVFLRRRTA